MSGSADLAQLRSVGWGIVGTGAIAHQFCADLALLPSARIAAIHSRSAGNAEAFRASVGAAKAYADLDAFLADPSIEVVYIATPNSLHVEQALLALSAGKAVLVEKPLAVSPEGAREIAQAAARYKRFAMEAMWTRFLPAVSFVVREVAARRIGRIRAIRANLSFQRTEIAGDRFFEPALGGGAALDLGVYPVSLAIRLLGRPAEVSGRWFAAASGVDCRSEFTLRYPDAVAELSCGFDRDGDNFFLIEGSAGTIRLEAPFLKAKRVTIFSAAASKFRSLGADHSGRGLAAKMLQRLPVPGRQSQNFPFEGNGLQFQALAVMDALRKGETSSATMPLEDSIATLEVIAAVLAADPDSQGGERPG